VNIASLIMGFILGAVATFIFMMSQKSSVTNASNENATDNKLKFNPMLGVFVLVPILAGLVYWKTGSPDASSVSVPATAMPAADASPEPAVPADMGAGHEMGDLGAMAQKLADKLAQDPNNADGWALLAHAYVELKEHKNAVGAFSKAVELIPNDPQLLADYADALAVTNNGNFEGKSAELVEAALKIDPNHPKALLLAGTIAYNKADYTKAIGSWEHLAPLVPKDDPMLSKQLEANIAEAKSLLAKK
jgi:cytochrome c-type biogenesis protein CcmH